MSKSTLVSLSLLTLGLVACGDDPPTPSEVRARIAQDLTHVIDEGVVASEGAAEGAPNDAAFSMIDRMLGSTDGEVSARMRAKIAAFVVERQVKAAMARLATPEEPSEEESPADAIVSYLNENIFTDANHLGEGVYQVPAALLCTETTFDENGNEVSELNAECATQVTQAEIRVRVTSDSDDEMDFTLQMTAEREEPLAVELRSESVALTVDLDDAWRSAAALAAIAGDELPNAALSGQVTGKLAILGTAHAALSLTVDRAISVKLADDGVSLDGPDAIRFSTAAADAFAIDLDGTAKAGTLALGVGETYLHVPSLFEEASEPSEPTFELDLAGLTATATFAQGQPMTIANAGLGSRDLVVKLGGQVSQRIGVNPDDGRVFSATITDDAATGRATVSVSPVLDLRMFTDHAVEGSEPAVYDVTRVLVTGALSTGVDSTAIQVDSGNFSIETSPAAYGFTATAGQCVTAEETIDSTSGTYYTTYVVGACQ